MQDTEDFFWTEIGASGGSDAIESNLASRRCVGGIEIDYVTGGVQCSSRPVRLTEGEFKLLSLLMSNPGTTFTRERIAAELWGDQPDVDVRTVDQKVRRLRRALNRGPAPDPICSVRGKGYKFSETYEKDYVAWLSKGRKRFHMKEIIRMRKRVKR
ncbi:MAG: winged helix-turn-helix transcriptional regulator [Rhizobiales bacterium]|nr:winged helix-turn-helix transcriptional regulator [Hyphomicrobiales bacterium]